MDGFYLEPLTGGGFLVVYETCGAKFTVACSTGQDILDTLAKFLRPYMEDEGLEKMAWPYGPMCPWLKKCISEG